MRIVPIPVLSDNYSYLIIDDKSNEAAIVDPAEPHKVTPVISEHKVKLTHLLTTHHHADHSGGNEEMAEKFSGLTVVGSARDSQRIPALAKGVAEGDLFNVGGLQVKVYEVPCHTRGHVFYVVSDKSAGGPSVLFSGDTLFIAGCGRFFEGDGAQMYHALIEVASKLPDDTLVYPGHEYTVQNLIFAKHVEPDNKAVQEFLAECQQKRARGEFTVPSTIGLEKKVNPFMRVREPSVAKAAGATDPVEVMSIIRQKKDSFRG